MLFSKDDLYITAPQVMLTSHSGPCNVFCRADSCSVGLYLPQAEYQTVSIASGFSNAIHAAVQPNGNVIAVTSCGFAPSTGSLSKRHSEI